MKSNKRLLMVAVPLLIALAAMAFYEYVYLEVMSDIASIREEQELKMKTLQKYVNLIDRKADFEKQLADRRELAANGAARFIPGETISIASANLQGLVKGIVVGRGGTITSERIGKAEPLEKTSEQTPGVGAAAPEAKVFGMKKRSSVAEPPKMRTLSVSIDATVQDVAALSDILYSIETRTPDLVIKELDVRVRNFKDPRELLVRIDVVGLYEGK